MFPGGTFMQGRDESHFVSDFLGEWAAGIRDIQERVTARGWVGSGHCMAPKCLWDTLTPSQEQLPRTTESNPLPQTKPY